jgi:hypothetical protein
MIGAMHAMGENAMPAPWPRAAFGFFAAVLSVLMFHQGMWAVLHALKEMPPPYPTWPVAPFGLPFTVDLCFWGGVWGALFALLLPALPPGMPMWLLGLGLGILAALVGLFVVDPLKGHAVAGGFALMAFVNSFLINGCWGLGVGLILPLLLPGVTQRG